MAQMPQTADTPGMTRNCAEMCITWYAMVQEVRCQGADAQTGKHLHDRPDGQILHGTAAGTV